MGLISTAADNTAASGVQAGTAVGTAAYSLTGWSYSDIAAIVSIVVSIVFLWGALPRWWRTTYALWRCCINLLLATLNRHATDL